MSVTTTADLAGRCKATQGKYPGVREPVNYGARHAPGCTRAANGKCLTRVYQMGLHEALSVNVTIIGTSSSSSSSINMTKVWQCRLHIYKQLYSPITWQQI